MKKKKGFTLVELLAVIVILAVILIIAVPRITDVINNSKKASFESSAKTIAAQAEKKYMEQQVLGNTDTISCSDIANINSTDYASCTITFDASGNASVSITGSGKFAGLTIRNATKNSATATELTETAAEYFSYEEVEVVKTTTMSSFEVEDVNKCTSYFQTMGITEEQATTLCTGGLITVDDITISLKNVVVAVMSTSDYETAGLKVENMDIIVENVEVKDTDKCKSYIQTLYVGEKVATEWCTTNVGLSELREKIVQGLLPLIVYEEAGLNVTYRPYTSSITITGYNIEGGLDVVIPSMIDGKTVVAIADKAFTTDGVAPTGISNTNNNYKISKLNYNDGNNYVVKKIAAANIGLGIKSVIIPNTITSIGESAFKDNKLTNVVIPNSVTSIGASAFSNNQLTSIVIPSSVTYIGAAAFGYNQIKSITFPTTPITLGRYAFAGNPIMEDGTYTYPDNVTVIISE